MTNFDAELVLGKFFKETGYKFPTDTEHIQLIALVKMAAEGQNKQPEKPVNNKNI